MSVPTDLLAGLIDVDDSLLVVIDVQDHFLDKYDAARARDVVARIAWLLRVAEVLAVPVVAMAEDPDKRDRRVDRKKRRRERKARERK